MASLGQKLRALRKERRMTQQELCAGLVTSSMISQIESDRVAPSPQLLEELARRLGVQPSYFAEDFTQHTDLAQTYRKARSLLETQHYDAALPLLLEVIRHPHHLVRDEVLYGDLAECYEALERWDEACDAYEQVVRISLEKDDVPSAVHACYSLGHLFRKQNRLAMARMYWQRAVELLSRHPGIEMPLEVKVRANLGRTHYLLGEHPAALTHLETAARLAEARGLSLDLATIRHTMGNVLMETGRHEEARQALEQAMELYARTRNQRGYNQCLVNLGVNLRLAGDIAGALSHLDRCVEDHELQRDSIRLANAYSERALCRLVSGDYTGAEEDARTALGLDRYTKSLQLSARATCAAACLALGRPQEARQIAEQALAGWEADADTAQKVQLLNVIRRAYAALGDTVRAREAALQLAGQLKDAFPHPFPDL
ncbi:MAG: helix-turn-helix transcriptional regulator [Alicyclobacillus macrosporangiidus]|uniref:helix-turn-helix transcriptional regulator n=1 Tax=Alicyclobacillus macrosporangiidus TaxID=392015 RepID=UPI0026EA602A|nr:helix-turn-helix transcriptional regulator [Alicyclobacillus macrosporangiidus]MCL6597985.1 helix-turn-helix transcriptional regulator [Alicyclobacillus macrosporangiidus]